MTTYSSCNNPEGFVRTMCEKAEANECLSEGFPMATFTLSQEAKTAYTREAMLHSALQRIYELFQRQQTKANHGDTSKVCDLAQNALRGFCPRCGEKLEDERCRYCLADKKEEYGE